MVHPGLIVGIGILLLGSQGVSAIKMKVRPGQQECMTELIHSDHFTVGPSVGVELRMQDCKSADTPCHAS